MSICNGCAYNLGNTCQVLKNKQIDNCSSKANKAEAIEREKAIQEYPNRFNEQMLERETVKQKLNRKFLELYKEELNDKEIAEALKVSPSSVGQYRKDMGLKVNKKKSVPPDLPKKIKLKN